jgi:hypothetical protein
VAVNTPKNVKKYEMVYVMQVQVAVAIFPEVVMMWRHTVSCVII